MRYLRKFNESESYSIFNSKDWKKLLPNELVVVNNNGDWILKLPEVENNMGHVTNISNLMNAIQISYYQNTPSREDGNVLRDGEPDQLAFDITIVKNNDGSHANPDTLKLNIDITYGDSVASSFIIEKPSKVEVTHYTGFGSMYDPETYFAFDDNSLKSLVNFFNSFGFQLTPDNFTFIDKNPDSYVHQQTNESIKLNPLFSNEYVLIINNSQPQENRYLSNIIKYLDFRAIPWKIASIPSEVEKMNEEFKIIGAISSGSEWRINDANFGDKSSTCKKAFEILSCPIFSICYGMQSLCKLFGSDIISSDELIKGSYKLENTVDHPIFKGIDLNNTNFIFSFHDYPKECPSGFKVIGEYDGKIVAIANDDRKLFGTLFHPEDIENTYVILDNFMEMCKSNINDAEKLKGDIKITNVVESYLEFIKRFK